MQKTIKVVNILLIVVMVLFSLSSVVMASSDDPVGGIIGEIEKNDGIKAENNGISAIGGKIAGILTTIGIVVAVIVLLVLGIKYMVGSAQEKAEYKKTMIPYIIGAVLLLSASGIVRLLFSALKIVG